MGKLMYPYEFTATCICKGAEGQTVNFHFDEAVLPFSTGILPTFCMTNNAVVGYEQHGWSREDLSRNVQLLIDLILHSHPDFIIEFHHSQLLTVKWQNVALWNEAEWIEVNRGPQSLFQVDNVDAHLNRLFLLMVEKMCDDIKRVFPGMQCTAIKR